MALWLVRAGKHGQHEAEDLTLNRVAIGWSQLGDLSKVKSREELSELLRSAYPDESAKTIANYTGQLWAFRNDMQVGDWAVVPSKRTSSIHIAEIAGEYAFEKSESVQGRHYHPVKWIANNVPRSNFDQDILHSFGALMTVCRIKKKSAEERIRKKTWITGLASARTPKPEASVEIEEESSFDIEELARDQVARLIISKYKGHGLARLINAILLAQGYTTHLSPEGPDKGIDILAALGPLGFGSPRICVQVKSTDSPIDRPTLDQLIGSMQNFHADQGLLVSWGGFKVSVEKEVPAQFFRVRLWGQKEIIEQLQAHYDKLDEEIRAELPLKRIWITALEDE